MAPGGDIGNVVLQCLKLADKFSERFALPHVGEGILQHPVEHPGAECPHHDAFIVERRQQHVPRPARLAQHEFVGYEHLIEMDDAGSHRAHAEFRQGRDFHAGRFGRHPKQRHALMTLLHLPVGPRQEQQIIGHMRGRTPDFLAADDPASVAAMRLRAQRPEDIGTASGLGEGNGGTEFAGSDLRQKFLLLRVRSVHADRLGACEGGDAPDPRQTGERASERAPEDHLHDHIAALAAVALIDADAVKARLGEFIPERERILVFVPFQLAGPALG